MTNSKTTRKALLSSALALTMCVAMLIGTTFAWFTDTASTAVNKIQSGTLDVALEMATAWDTEGKPATWASAEGKTLAFKKAAGAAENEAVLWEPGCTYELPELRVVNNGNLALKYKVIITGIKGSAKLNTVIDWTIANDADDTNATDLASTEYHLTAIGTENASDILTISGHMQETAGNDYQDLTIDGISITVVATQDKVEYDSEKNTYDENAEYPVQVTSATELSNALAAGKDVVLTQDIELTAAVTINGDAKIVGDGKSIISQYPVNVAKDANVTFQNVNFATPTNTKNNASSVYAKKLEGKVVYDGCTFTNPQWECIQITPVDGADITVTNCTFIVDGTGTYAKADGTKVERMLHIQNDSAPLADHANYTVTVKNNKFIGVDLCNNSVIDIDDIAAFANVTCGGNTFYNHDGTAVTTPADGMIYVNIVGGYSGEYVATNTYAQFTQSPAKALVK